ncbi:MAG: [FeFe] hydrogenase H-cluster maturation GTPase HydF [Oscillospiraceae bacterium]|nr:[FeFe] hydrogenase H-cluster maturation GTPase HydF [Oscillospiraceae bacterium]
MGLNDTVSAERVHIGFFGLRNAGKSSLVNAVTGQELSVVSEIKGTTTDPVRKAMELLPLGAVVIIDTPGFDDDGKLGALRVKKAREILAKTDLAVLTVDAARGLSTEDNELVKLFEERKIPFVIAFNKADLLTEKPPLDENSVYVSAVTKEGVNALKERLGSFAERLKNEKHIVSDLLSEGDIVVLVIPVDEAAPKGRLILPQQQTMRELLDAHCSFVGCQPEELSGVLSSLAKKPRLVITDSQAFGRVSKDVPADIFLTSFSILFARYKGELAELVNGARALETLKDGDRVLISEGCTHHRQCGDIGTVKLPKWIEEFTGDTDVAKPATKSQAGCLRPKAGGVKPEFSFTSGGEFPEDLSEFKLVVHCGGCMLNEKEMRRRAEIAKNAGVPMVNYGIAIAHIHGILKRSLEPFPNIQL